MKGTHNHGKDVETTARMISGEMRTARERRAHIPPESAGAARADKRTRESLQSMRHKPSTGERRGGKRSLQGLRYTGVTTMSKRFHWREKEDLKKEKGDWYSGQERDRQKLSATGVEYTQSHGKTTL